MKPDDARQLLSATLGGELDEPTRREVEAALDADPALRRELDALRRTAELVRSMPRERAPQGFAARVAAAIETSEKPASVWAGWPRLTAARWWTPAVVAAAACLIVGLTAFLRAPPRSERTQGRIGPPPKPPATVPAEHAPADREAAAENGMTMNRDKTAEPKAEGLRKQAGKSAAGPMAPAEAPTEPEAAPAPEAPRAATPAPPPAPVHRRETARAKEDAEAGKRMEDKGLAATEPAPQPAIVPAIVAAPARTGEKELLAERKAAAESEGLKSLIDRIETGRPAPRPAAGPAAAPVKLEAAPSSVAAPGAPAKPTATVKKAKLAEAGEGYGFAAAESTAKAGGALLPRVLAVAEYTDLRRCLTDVQATLDAARVPYALQPQGAGGFVVEATVTEAQAQALLARLAPPMAKAKAKDETRIRGTGAGAAPPTDVRKDQGDVSTPQSAAPRVHLVVQFLPVPRAGH